MKPDLTKKYTYDDYYGWGEDAPRCELIDGIVYMAPAPKPIHQEIAGILHTRFQVHLWGRKSGCKVYSAPFDVRLDADKGNETTVQPDVTVICDRRKIDDKGCKGAPELVVEVLSDSTKKRDMIIKYEKYREAGVLEYWIVHPDIKSIQVHSFKDGVGRLQNYTDDMEIASSVLPGLKLTPAEVFPDDLEAEAHVD